MTKNNIFGEKANNGIVSAIMRKAKQSPTNSISAKDFLVLMQGEKNKTSKGNKDSKGVAAFEFRFVAKPLKKTLWLFTLYGKHQSTNAINSFTFRKKLVYKSAIKKAAKYFFESEWLLIKQSSDLSILPFKKAVMRAVAYNPKSRDDDGCSITLKIIRDIIVSYGFLIDDKRDFLVQEKTYEVIAKEYKIDVYLEMLGDDEIDQQTLEL